MRNLYILTLSVLIITSLLTINVSAGSSASQPELEKVDNYIHAEMDDLNIPGLEAVIVHKDEIVYAKGFGVADVSGRAVKSQTPMILGSVSKGFTALAVMQLVEAGKVKLDAPVTEYLPVFRLADNPDMDPPDAWSLITIRQLLNHTSGIPEYAGANSFMSSYAGDDALEKQIASFVDFELIHLPGGSFAYSNANYQTLGLIVQTVSGEPFESYVQNHIFTPLEMQNSYLLVSEAKNMATGYRFFFGTPIASPNVPAPRSDAPSAFVISNAEDMGHYLIAQMNDGKYSDVQILSPQGMETLHSSSVDIDNGYKYVFGWAVDPDGNISHNGETPTFTSGIRIEGDWGVFVVRNIAADQREQRLDEIVPGILSIIRGEEPVQNTVDPSFRRIVIGLAVILILQVVGIVSAWRKLWKHKADQRSARAVIGIALGLLIYLSLACELWYAGPISNHRAFGVLFQSAPDQLLLLGVNVLLALIGMLVQVARLLRIKKPSFHDTVAST
jgi:CubicO group peptidase (beta-lactamase class C family)